MGKLTKKELEAVAEELNEVMALDPPITTGRKTKVENLEEDIKDVVENHLTDEDEISDDTKDLILRMQAESEMEPEVVEEVAEEEVVEEVVEEAVEEAVEIPTETKPKAQNKVQKEKAKVAKDKKENTKYTRAQAFCEALSAEPKTLTEIAQKAMDLHGKNNPGKKQPQLASIEWAVRDYIQPLIILGFVELKNKKYSLK